MLYFYTRGENRYNEKPEDNDWPQTYLLFLASGQGRENDRTKSIYSFWHRQTQLSRTRSRGAHFLGPQTQTAHPLFLPLLVPYKKSLQKNHYNNLIQTLSNLVLFRQLDHSLTELLQLEVCYHWLICFFHK